MADETNEESLRVAPFMLTDTHASEHMYGERLQAAMADRPVTFVDDWRDADVAHLFEVNLFTRAALTTGRFLDLFRLLRSDVSLVVSTDDLYFSGDPSLTSHPRLYGLNHRLQRALFARADAIVAMSGSVRDRLAPAVPETPIHVVHHGVDPAYYDTPSPDDDPFVLHVSLAAPRKNPAAIRAVAEGLDARFVVAGGGWPDELDDADLGPNVEVPGYVPEDELLELYGRAGVFYFPTRHEGFGLPVLEAMASRNAVVSTDAYAVPEVTGDAAVLHDPHDIDAHLDSIRDLLADDEHRRDLADAARERSREFSWDDAAAETLAVYRSVVG